MRPFTEQESYEVYQLCSRGRSGSASPGDAARCEELHRINPVEYGKIQKSAREDVDSTINPLATISELKVYTRDKET